MNKKAQVMTKEQFWMMVLSIIAVALVFGNGGLANKIIVLLVGFFLVNPTLSSFVDSIIDSFGGEFLNDYKFNIEIFGFEFSRTAYAILSAVLLFLLFR